jgi:hypothetical protein
MATQPMETVSETISYGLAQLLSMVRPDNINEHEASGPV